MFFAFLYLCYKVVFLGARVGLLINLFEVFWADMGVSLGGGQIPVAQKLLNGSQVASAGQQVGRKGVAERMRADLLAEGGFSDPFGHYHTRPPIRQPEPMMIQKQGGCFAQGGGTALNIGMDYFESRGAYR